MKLSEAMKLFDRSWVRKKEGFRVCFQQDTCNGLETDHVPAMDENMLDSDVTAWRTARKLALSSDGAAIKSPEDKLFNIFVVDDQGNPIKHYSTNRYEMYNPVKED